jgi:hypothetical protein
MGPLSRRARIRAAAALFRTKDKAATVNATPASAPVAPSSMPRLSLKPALKGTGTY